MCATTSSLSPSSDGSGISTSKFSGTHNINPTDNTWIEEKLNNINCSQIPIPKCEFRAPIIPISFRDEKQKISNVHLLVLNCYQIATGVCNSE